MKSFNIGDTFSYGSTQDRATITKVDGDNVHVTWELNGGWEPGDAPSTMSKRYLEKVLNDE